MLHHNNAKQNIVIFCNACFHALLVGLIWFGKRFGLVNDLVWQKLWFGLIWFGKRFGSVKDLVWFDLVW